MSFGGLFQVLDYALKHVDDRRVLLFANALHGLPSHLNLQLEDGVALRFASVGKREFRCVALTALNQPPFLNKPLDELFQLTRVNEGLHSVQHAAPCDGACFVDAVEHLPTQACEAVVAEYLIDVFGNGLVGVLEPITDGRLLRYVSPCHLRASFLGNSEGIRT